MTELKRFKASIRCRHTHSHRHRHWLLNPVPIPTVLLAAMPA
jgi:hypothetical protein